MLPKGLYDALPWLYMALGALSSTLLDGDLKYLPATMFVLAGCLVFAFRYVPKPSVPHRDVPARALHRSTHRH